MWTPSPRNGSERDGNGTDLAWSLLGPTFEEVGVNGSGPENYTLGNGTRGGTVGGGIGFFSWTQAVLVALFCCIIAGTVIGNTLVIAAVATTRRLRTVTNCFVMSLAVADWLVGMFVMPPKVVFHLSNGVWNFGPTVCQIWIALDVMLCTSSILSLCTISIDRYLAITRPLAYSRRRRSKRLALAMISCVWVSSVVITSPPMLGWKGKNHDEDSKSCDYNDDQVYVVYSALGSFFLPLLVMLYVYARIACVIAQRQKSIQRAHKSKDKKCEVSDETLIPGDEVGVPKLKNGSSAQHGSKKSTTTFHFFTKSGSGHQKPSISLFNRLRRFRKSSFKSKNDQIHTRSGAGGLNGGPDLREVPSPSTILTIGNGRPGGEAMMMPTQLPLGNGYRKGGVNGVNGPSRWVQTGSRLCHHSLTSYSPPRSIIHRVQSSAATRVPGFSAEPEIELRARPWSQQNPHGSRVWTVEDEEEELEKQTHSTLNLSSSPKAPCACHPSLRTSSIDDLRSAGQAGRVHVGRYSYHPPPRGSVLHPTNLVKGRSQVVRSRSVKVNLHFGAGDGPVRDLPTGRVASFKRETKTAQTLAAVVGGFIICWLPFFVAYVLDPFLDKGTVPHDLMEAFIWLGWGNSAINPFIYAFYSADFRSAFWRLTLQKCNGLLRSGRSPDRASPKRDNYQYAHGRRVRYSAPNLAPSRPPVTAIRVPSRRTAARSNSL